MTKRKWSFEEVEEYRRMHNQYFFYFNPDDANFRVPGQDLENYCFTLLVIFTGGTLIFRKWFC
jgi:hypothetical protein